MVGDESKNKALWERWVSPSVAVDLLKRPDLHFETAAKTIGQRLRAGLIGSIAEVVMNPEGTERKDFAPVTEKVWQHWAPLEDYDFWRTGDIHLSKAGTTGYGDDRPLVSLFGVRFNPDDVAKLLPVGTTKDNDPQLVDAPNERKWPDLPEALLDEWAKLFNKANPDASEAGARAAIDAMFPKHYVTRTRIRRVLPERRAGRPLKEKGK